MGLFKSNKKEVLDLTERYKRQKERLKELQENIKENSSVQSQGINSSSKNSENLSSLQRPDSGMFGFFNMASANSESAGSNSSISSSPNSSDSENYLGGNEAEDKKKKLAKRLIDLTNKLEDLSNQIYRLQQRMEVIEKKLNIANF